jgi:hypothetical protein
MKADVADHPALGAENDGAQQPRLQRRVLPELVQAPLLPPGLVRPFIGDRHAEQVAETRSVAL